MNTVGNKGLGAVDNVVITVTHCAGAHSGHVATGAGLSHGQCSDDFSGYHTRQPLMFLFVSADIVDIRCNDIGMNVVATAKAVHVQTTHFVLDHLDDLKAGTGCAINLRHIHQQQSRRSHGAPNLPRHNMVFFPLLIVGQ